MSRGKRAYDVAHAWAHDLWVARRSGDTVFVENGVIYSYGLHFPMAAKFGNDVLLSTAHYSSTIAGHQTAVGRAVSHLNIINCYGVPRSTKDIEKHIYNIECWVSEVKAIAQAFTKARKKLRYVEQLDSVRKEVTAYLAWSGYKIKAKDRKEIFDTTLEDYEAVIRKEQKEALAKRQLDLMLGEKLYSLIREEWRNYKTKSDYKERDHELAERFFDDVLPGNVSLRTDGKTVETSKEVSLPVAVAKRIYDRYMAVIASGGCSGNCPDRILEYQVQEMNADRILVGCHDIPRSEIDYIAGKLNW